MSTLKSFLLLSCSGLLLASCADSTGPKNSQRVNFAFSGVRASSAPALRAGLMASVVPGPGDSLVIVNGTDTLIITKVEVVARKIRLKGAESTDCDESTQLSDCEELMLDARLIRLPLALGVSTPVGVDVPNGTYSGFDIHIHKPTSSSGDVVFLATNPTWPSSTSVRVTGYRRGVAFTFTSDVVFKIDQRFSPPLVIGVGETTNLTIRIDVASWFRSGASGALIDPATAGNGGANRNVVEQNIRNSVRAFRDNDQDGDESDG